MSGDKPVWETDGSDWPHRAHSRFVSAGGIDWHVQILGEGPALLLLHGTGASGHSWRDLMPGLAERFQVIVPDLPGHGFTSTPPRSGLSLPGMARGLKALCQALDLRPALIAGHSAGAAVALQMCLDPATTPQGVVGTNGALMPFKGAAHALFSPMAKLLSLNPLVPRLLSFQAGSPEAVRRYLKGTGSKIDVRGVALYHRLVSRSGHIAAMLSMMANWDLQPLVRSMDRIHVPVLLIVGEQDRAVPPADSEKAAAKLPEAEIVRQPGLGHLAHEEAPEETARLIIAHGERCGIGAGVASARRERG